MTIPVNYNYVFKEALQKLNIKQREAVEHIEGPVLVIAGPGTGKTQILSARIGNILTRTQVNPHNILCLTFTDAGAFSMHKRLLSLIGQYAYRVKIYTFHAFCNEVIQENLEYFGIGDLQPVSELENIKIFKKLIDSFGVKHALKRFRGEVYYDIPRLQSLFKIMKEENWSTEFIRENIDKYLKDLPNRDNFIYKDNRDNHKKGDLKIDAINKKKEEMEKLEAAATEFNNHQNLMLQHKRYDYNDMIQWTIKAFKESPHILMRYQEQFQYFLVDEYQDTNSSQNEVLNLLTSYWEIPNVFVVGDDDQSIFRFQGANVSNILDFQNKYGKFLKNVVLTDNYRSSQKILDVANPLIKRNNERLVNKIKGIDKSVIAQNPEYKSSPIIPRVIEYKNTLHEESALVSLIEEMYNQKVDLSEIAVIYRQHQQVENIVKALAFKKIPVNVKKKIDVLSLPFANKLVNIFRYIQHEYELPNSGEYLLFQIMHYDFFNIQSMDIARIFKACHSQKTNTSKLTSRELIVSKELMFQLHIESIKEIKEFADNLNKWIAYVPNLTLEQLFEKIITEGGILAYVLKSSDKIWLMQVLVSLFKFVKEESSRNVQIILKGFLDILEEMGQNKISLSLSKDTFINEGVNFLTAHASKGLEFKYVFVMGCTSNIWDKASSNRKKFTLPDTLTPSVTSDETEESRRLFYVAITRAQQYLVISYSVKDNDEKSLEKSLLVADVIEDNKIIFEKPDVSDDKIVEHYVALMSPDTPSEIQLNNKAFIDSMLENYRLSLTHLNDYIECPLKFYFEDILRVPASANEVTGFGSAVHYALQKLFTVMKTNDNIFPRVDEFLKYFVYRMRQKRSSFTEEQFKRRLEYGNLILPAYYNNYVNIWNKITVLEYPVMNAEISGIPLTGIIDKIEFDGNKVNVVDYKTGNVKNGKSRLNPPNNKDQLGGKYWRQIVFYKILMDNDRTKTWEMDSGEIDFIEPEENKFTKSRIFVQNEQIKTVELQIKDTYEKIMNHQFNKGCDEKNCRWCNFVKNDYNHKLKDILVEEEQEILKNGL